MANYFRNRQPLEEGSWKVMGPLCLVYVLWNTFIPAIISTYWIYPYIGNWAAAVAFAMALPFMVFYSEILEYIDMKIVNKYNSYLPKTRVSAIEEYQKQIIPIDEDLADFDQRLQTHKLEKELMR